MLCFRIDLVLYAHVASVNQASRLISTQDNFPQDGNGQKMFLCFVSCRSENTKETFLSVPVLRKVLLTGNQPLQVLI